MNTQQPIVFTTTSGLCGGVLNELNTSNLINTENLQIPINKEHNYASVFILNIPHHFLFLKILILKCS